MYENFKLFKLISNITNHIGPELISHGKRVSYIVNCIMHRLGTYSEEEMREISVLALLHDMGAYKTDEIENLVDFECNDVWGHSIYGYSFLSFANFLPKYSDAILFHHLKAQDFSKFDFPHKTIANMIFLADRIDILCLGKTPLENNVPLDDLLKGKYNNTWFQKPLVDAFVLENKTHHVIENIKSNTFLENYVTTLHAWALPDTEIDRLIFAIGSFIDFRSENTVTHNITTISIAGELGLIMNLSSMEIKKLVCGATLHDVGKISTPLEILEKNGKLSEEEMDIMKLHVSFSEEILQGVIDDEIVKIACRHHEKLDGLGYPHGIKDLSLSERILAVADIISALNMKRSYKDKFEKTKILELLMSERDSGKLDAAVVNAAMENYDKIMNNTDKNCNEILGKYSGIKEQSAAIHKYILKKL